MKKITICNKNAIWLDHAALIREAYQDYELREELFHFNANNKNHEETEQINTPDLTKTRKRRKKQKLAQSLETDANLDLELAELKCKVAAYIKQLHEQVTFKHLPDDTATNSQSTLPRHWEEQHEFPKFKGANEHNASQRYSFGEQTYLIPAHARFYNHNVTQLTVEILPELGTYDLIVMDPPWRNKYIRRLKRLKLQLAYNMLDNTELQQMPIDALLQPHTLVAIWCTNAAQHQQALLSEFLPAWNLRLVHAVKWLKLNTCGTPISELKAHGHKQPYEMLYIACHCDNTRDFSELKNVELMLSIPSIVHSHKPPLLPWLRQWLPAGGEPKCLELFARYLQPHYTSIGLEVLKLMDERLYKKI